MGRRRLSLGKVLDCLCLSSDSIAGQSCICINSAVGCLGSSDFHGRYDEDEFESERQPLVPNNKVRLKDLVSGGQQSLALHLKPKTVVLKVSMHCNGCARRVEKQVSKIDGVTSYKVDLETKMVVLIGDILPFEVLESVSRVKHAQLWTAGI